MDDKITNEAGQIAIRYYQPAPVLVKGTVTGKEYIFDVRAAISLAWVDPQDAEGIVGRIKHCCGGNKRHPFDYANQDAARIWTNGGGR